jgi:hypothetical protein
MNRIFLACFTLALSLPAFAQQGAIITALQGRVTFEQDAPVPRPAAAFARLRSGDKLQLAAEGVVQVVYFQSARQESWHGPVRLEIGETESLAVGGATPVVRQLPPMLVRQLVKTPTADASGRVGAVRMRAIVPPDAGAKLDENYQALRRQTDAGDRSPELYLLAGLYELKDYERIEGLLAGWIGAAPGDAELLAMRDHYAQAIRDARAKAPQ